jgi:hypothetical protein
MEDYASKGKRGEAMHPMFQDQLVKDHIAELRDDSRLAHLSELGNRGPSARQRLGLRLVDLGERLLMSSPASGRR